MGRKGGKKNRRRGRHKKGGDRKGGARVEGRKGNVNRRNSE